jgi:nucleotide-binding universal stress UspA family protein
MKAILVAADFSPVTDDAIVLAGRLGRALGTPVWLLHVAQPDPDFVGYEAGPPNVRDQVARDMHDTHARLQGYSAQLREQGVDATAIQVQGSTVETILHEAARLGAELIVLGSHGHGALRRALLGSVSEGVLHRAACPVLIVPSHKTGD